LAHEVGPAARGFHCVPEVHHEDGLVGAIGLKVGDNNNGRQCTFQQQ
jgi:hypothetical protein